MNFDELAKLGIDPVFLATIVGTVVGAMAVIKRLPFLASRKSWLPVVSVVVGVAATAATAMAGQTTATGWQLVAHVAIYGSLAGLMACGVYDVAGKPVGKKIKAGLAAARELLDAFKARTGNE